MDVYQYQSTTNVCYSLKIEDLLGRSRKITQGFSYNVANVKFTAHNGCISAKHTCTAHLSQNEKQYVIMVYSTADRV